MESWPHVAEFAAHFESAIPLLRGFGERLLVWGAVEVGDRVQLVGSFAAIQTGL